MSKENRCIIIYTEGETDEQFYRELLKYYGTCTDKYTPIYQKVIIKCLRGFGNFKFKVPRKFEKEIAQKFPDLEHHVFLAYDTDVFQFKSKPPINWQQVEKSLYTKGAFKVYHIKAEKMIEDWFLDDLDGLCTFLKIPIPPKLKGTNGLKKIGSLFKQSNKNYEKGYYTTHKFIPHLDLSLIQRKRSEVLKLLRDCMYKEK